MTDRQSGRVDKYIHTYVIYVWLNGMLLTLYYYEVVVVERRKISFIRLPGVNNRMFFFNIFRPYLTDVG